MRKLLLTVATATVLGGLACHDSSLAPSSPPVLKGSSAAANLGSQFLTKQFTISPTAETTVDIHGLFTVRFPAGSVCDPNITTGCVPATEPISVTATVAAVNGNMQVDFTPHLTFVNSTNPARWVVLSTNIYAQSISANKSYFASNRSKLRRHELLYASGFGAKGIHEANVLGDPTLRTRVSLKSGLIWRRITHFSGYQTAYGEPCEPSPLNPDCVWVDDGEDPPDEDPPGYPYS